MTSLAALDLPASDEGWSRFLRARCDDMLADAGAQVIALKAAAPGDPVILEIWNDLQIDLANAFAAAMVMAQVHPLPEVREQAERAEVEAQRFRTDLMLDESVHAQLSSLDVSAYDDPARRLVERTLRDFSRSGVDRDEETRARLRDVEERETALVQEFSRGIRNGRATTRLPASALDGLPEDYVAAHPADADGMVELGTEYPDTLPFIAYSRDAEARRAVMATFLNVGWPDNDRVLGELLRVRDEHARLLGYDGWPDLDAEVRMIGDGASIAAFIDQISRAAEEPSRRDLEVLAEQAHQEDPDAVLDLSSWRYHQGAVHRNRFAVDSQEVRRYFDFTKVGRGLLDVTSRLFGLEYVDVRGASTWHEDVTAYDVRLDGELLGRIHLDLHPRDGKFNHAAHFRLVPGVGGRQLPEGVLVCNFPRGLMEHSDVVTLFHEFGHLLHHVLAGRHEWVRFSGVSTERDFIEAPSQMLEEWAWDADVLAGFATDADGEPIPADLVARMRRAADFGKGYLTRIQMFYSAVSYRLHVELPDDISALVGELHEQHHPFAPLPGTHFHTQFGHLEDYSSAYYTYTWSLVIAKDLFSAFDAGDLFAPEVALRYRDRVLTPGGSRDAAALVEDFLGRPYTMDAFTAWLNR